MSTGPSPRTSATYTIELLGAPDKTPDEAAAAVAAALAVPLDRAQRLLGGKRFRITVTASPPRPEVSPAVTKLLAAGVDLAVIDDETKERHELSAARPKPGEVGKSGSIKVEPTSRFKLPADVVEAAQKQQPTSSTGLKPIRLVERPAPAGRAETTARYAQRDLLGATPEPTDTRKGGSSTGLAPVTGSPPDAAPGAHAHRSPTPIAAPGAHAHRSPTPIGDVPLGRGSSARGLPPVRDEAMGRAAAPSEATMRQGSRYSHTSSDGESSPPPSSRARVADLSSPPPSTRGAPPSMRAALADALGEPPSRRSAPPSTSGAFATPRPADSVRGRTPSSIPAPMTTLPASSPRPPPSDALGAHAVVPLAPRVPTSLSVPAPSPPPAPCSDCGVALGPQALLCASCGWDGERKLRRCGRCGGELVRAAVVGSKRVALVLLAVVTMLLVGGGVALLVEPAAGAGAALLVALFVLGARALVAAPRCKACGWVAPPPRPKAAAAPALPAPAVVPAK